MDLSKLPEEIIIKIFKKVIVNFLQEKKLKLRWTNDTQRLIDYKFICLNMEHFDKNGYIIFDSVLFKKKFPNACLSPTIDKYYLRRIIWRAREIKIVKKNFKKKGIIAGILV
jgi:hypothetical protein